VRQVLAIVIAVLSIAGAGYLVSHDLSNPYHFVYYKYPPLTAQGYCGNNLPTGGITHGMHVRCEPPTRAAWQIPLAVLLAILGLGAVGVVGSGAGRAARRPIPRLGARPPA
jgi:hypothetical protein